MFEEVTSDKAPDKIGDWVLRVGIALAFVLFGLDKFPSDAGAQWVRFFDQVGVGQWFRYLTGIVEVIGGALALIPAAARVGLAILATTMAVASAIHIFVIRQPANAIITIGLCVGLANTMPYSSSKFLRQRHRCTFHRNLPEKASIRSAGVNPTSILPGSSLI